MSNATRNRYRKIARLLEEARRLVQAGAAAYRSRWNTGRGKLRFALRVLIGRPAQRMLEWLREWYRGRYIPPRPNDPDSPIVVISPGHFEKPLLAKCLGAIERFWVAHWQWIIGIAVAVVGIIVTVM